MAKQAKKAAKSSDTLVTFLLDRTGSMGSVKQGTIEAFNAYLEGLQQEPAGIRFSFIQFDSQALDRVHVNVPVAQALKLTSATYQPRAATPLIDAAYKTIKAVEASEAAKGSKIVVCIQTDGEENSSTAHTWAELHALIKEKTALGWQFNFMGCGIDAYDQGQKMGIGAMNTMSYDRNSAAATRAAFSASAENTRNFAVGALESTSYSMAQRSLAGDAFAHKAHGLQGAPMGSVIRPNVSGAKASAAPVVPKPAPAAVDDFTL